MGLTIFLCTPRIIWAFEDMDGPSRICPHEDRTRESEAGGLSSSRRRETEIAAWKAKDSKKVKVAGPKATSNR